MIEMGVLSEKQKLLNEYLNAAECSTAMRMFIVGVLWDDNDIDEMFKYLTETKETDPQKLKAKACEIANYQEPSIMEQKWNKMMVLWMNSKLPSPYNEVVSYDADVRNESHLHHYRWLEEDGQNLDEVVHSLGMMFEDTHIKDIVQSSYLAYRKIKSNKYNFMARMTLKNCDKKYKKFMDEAESVMEQIAAKMTL